MNLSVGWNRPLMIGPGCFGLKCAQMASGEDEFWLKQIFLIYSVLIVFRSTDYGVVYVLRLLMIIPIL